MQVKADGYRIQIGKQALQHLSNYLKKKQGNCQSIILVDEHTKKHCLPILLKSVSVLQKSHIIEIKSGEQYKSIETCSFVWKKLSEFNTKRNAIVINLGGGMLSDLGAFCASTYMRGIDYINVPTTLLSMVDASVGGKTGINHVGLKNYVGLFSKPKAVFIDPIFLNTLPKNELLSGCAEMIKHSLIKGKNEWKKISSIKNVYSNKWDSFILSSIEIKNEIVVKDFHEKNIRKQLNLGHSIGHALESYFIENKKPITHGEAVAAGIVCEAYLAMKLLKFPVKEFEQVKSLILCAYPKLVFYKKDVNRILSYLVHDKKNNTKAINCSLLKKMGNVKINQQISVSLAKESLEYYIAL